MADPVVISVLAFLHIVAAITWLGADLFVVSVILPSVKTFTPGASLEFLTKAEPRIVRYFAGTSAATIVFGLGLLFEAFGPDYTQWPASIDIGFTLGFVAFLIAWMITIPSARKAERFAHLMIQSPQQGPPPPDFMTTMARLGMSAMLVGVILIVTAVFMVVTAFPW